MNASQPKLPIGCATLILVISAILGIGLALLIPYYLCRIDAVQQYGGWSGLWHGMNFLGNLILKIFNSDRLLMAPLTAGAYPVFYYIFAIGGCLIALVMMPFNFHVIKNAFKNMTE